MEAIAAEKAQMKAAELKLQRATADAISTGTETQQHVQSLQASLDDAKSQLGSTQAQLDST